MMNVNRVMTKVALSAATITSGLSSCDVDDGYINLDVPGLSIYPDSATMKAYSNSISNYFKAHMDSINNANNNAQ